VNRSSGVREDRELSTLEKRKPRNQKLKSGKRSQACAEAVTGKREGPMDRFSTEIPAGNQKS
jgi:hypothetical protein